MGNARLSADFFVARFGFTRVAYRGLETGSRSLVTHVVRQGRITFALTSSLNPAGDELLGSDIGSHVARHGDGVKDIAFSVTDARAVFEYAVARGARAVAPPQVLEDGAGTVITATVQTYGETTHTFVQRDAYSGAFLPGALKSPSALAPARARRPPSIEARNPLTPPPSPPPFAPAGYRAADPTPDAFAAFTPPIGLDFVDHIVGNVPEGDMEPTVLCYEKMLSFHRFWSVDDTQMHTEFSALKSIVVADHTERVKMPINEPAKGKRKSQIQEYCDYYAGAGVQHIALNTRDIISAITHLRARGVGFLRVPDAYYDSLEARLASAGCKVKEDLATIRKLNILLDMDDKGYLLQLFTQCVQDRPTVFLEVIQREGCSGFGAGNFKSLFEAIEREQNERGNLTSS